MAPSPDSPPRLLVTAGPTHEPIDSVRYIGNRSSGRMGFALAQASAARAWPTTLLAGPTPLPPPESSHLSVFRFRTTADLQNLLAQHWPEHDVLIMAAAVADFRPTELAQDRKLSRTERRWMLELEATPDLLAELDQITQPNQLRVGFALEPADRLIESARRKLDHKHLDAIVANPLQTMDSETIEATVLLADGRSMSPPEGRIPKEQFATWLLGQLEAIRSAR